MSEEVIEKSGWDVIAESIAKVNAMAIIFVILVGLFSLLLIMGVIDQVLFEKLILSGVLVSLLLKL